MSGFCSCSCSALTYSLLLCSPAVTDYLLQALWALRDFMLQEALGVVKIM